MRKKFSEKTSEFIDQGAIVLSISFAEIACKIKFAKLLMSITIEELYRLYTELDSIEIVDISVDDWLNSINLEWPDNKDPADRLITAYAMHKQLSIVTSDQKIKQFYSKVIW